MTENNKENLEKKQDLSNTVKLWNETYSEARQTEANHTEEETGVTILSPTSVKSKGKPGRKRKVLAQNEEDVVDDFLIISYTTLEDLEVSDKHFKSSMFCYRCRASADSY